MVPGNVSDVATDTTPSPYGADGDWTGVLASSRILFHRIAAITATLTPAATNHNTCSNDTAPRSRTRVASARR